jgi:integration host factor subunit beta
MKRSELVQRLARRFPALQPRDAQSAVNLICEAIAGVLREGRRIEIRGFGSFALSYRAARLNRNPRTGERVQVPPKYVPHFRTGKELRQVLVDQTARQEATRIERGLNRP